MDILSYLLELLQQSKEVGITGLGTFYKKKFPGRYDKEKQSFLPPGYTLQFSSTVKEEDALVNFISSKENIAVEEAKQYIAQFVGEINKKLEVEHEAELENTGRLFFTEHEGLSFEPAKNINYGSEFYGLPTVAEPEMISKEVKPDLSNTDHEGETYEEIAEAPIANHQSEKVGGAEQILPIIENVELDEVHDDLKNTLKHSEKPTEDEIDVPESIKKQHEEHPHRFGHKSEEEAPKAHHEPQQEEPITQAPEFIKEQHAEHPNRFGHDPLIEEPRTEESRSIWPKIGIAALILLVIGTIVYFVKSGSNPSDKVETKPTVITDSPKTEIDSTKAKQDSIAKTDSILKANQVAKTDSTKVNPAVSPAVGTQTFEIIAASYLKVKGAMRYIRNVKRVGINARIVDMPGKRQNISIGSFKTQKEAEEQLIVLQKKLNGKGFYIQKINTP